MNIEQAVNVLKEKKKVVDVDVWLEAFDMVVKSVEGKLYADREDVILVVRCKDCQHSKEMLGTNKLYCLTNYVDSNHYCGYGVYNSQNN